MQSAILFRAVQQNCVENGCYTNINIQGVKVLLKTCHDTQGENPGDFNKWVDVAKLTDFIKR